MTRMIDGRIGLVGAALLLALRLAGGAAAQDGWILSDSDEWVPARMPEPGPESELLEARRALAEDQHRRAESLATRWIERHADHPSLPDAYIIRGDARLRSGQEYESLFDYELVARRYPGTEAFVIANERELEIADLYANGLKRKVLGVRFVSAAEEAEKLYILIQERLPGSELAEQAALRLGDFYFRRREMILAAEMYDIFLENFPRSREVERARLRLISAHLASYKGPEFDASGLLDARTLLARLRANDPAAAQHIGAEALIGRIDETRARKLLTTARWYLKVDDVTAAEFTIRRLVDRYPRTAAAAEALEVASRIVPGLPPFVRREIAEAGVYPAEVLGTTDAAGGGEALP